MISNEGLEVAVAQLILLRAAEPDGTASHSCGRSHTPSPHRHHQEPSARRGGRQRYRRLGSGCGCCWGVWFRSVQTERFTPLLVLPTFPSSPPPKPPTVTPAPLLLPSELRVACVAALVYGDKSLLCLFCSLHRAEQAALATGGYFTARSRRLFLGLRNLIFVSE